MNNLFKSEKIYSVSELNTTVRNILRAEFPEYIWVCGEIQDLRERQHVNFNLVQKHDNLDEIVAHVKGVIFENVKTQIFKRLKEADSSLVLKDDIEVKLLCKVDLYVKTGQFSLSVFDIDPIYTLGRFAQNRLKIIEELKARGLLDKNKDKVIPALPLNIGLITSYGSAAYHDFISELKSSGYSFRLAVYDCFMQGKSAETNIVGALDFFNRIQEGPDVLVISRGGGSTADLAWFDNKKIAEAIAGCKFAVISALGHEINMTITDMVAHTTLKTPTKAAQFLVESVDHFSENLRNIETGLVEDLHKFISSKKEGLQALAIKIDSTAPRFFKVHLEELIEKQVNLSHITQNRLNQAKTFLGGSLTILRERLNKLFQNSKNEVKYIADKINLLNPRNILKRGYSVTYKLDKAVKSADVLKEGDIIKTLFFKGEINSCVKKQNGKDGSNDQKDG